MSIVNMPGDMWNRGSFHSLVGCMRPHASQASSIANQMLGCRPETIHPKDIEEIVRYTADLEAAAKMLRQIASIGKPRLLQAAE